MEPTVLEIRHLKTLHALREADSLVEAAERLHLTQSALSHQFKELEERMGKPGGLSNLFAGSRQAQYWQQFTELYSNISREAQEDFQDLFGREFSRAYEEHSARQRR